MLSAAVERILPSEDGPGAAEAGAAVWIEGTLAAEGNRSWRFLFEEGLGRLQALAGEIHGRPFPACSPGERDEVLQRFQEQSDPLYRAFFRQLVTLTLEGFLGDPAHGGNREGVGWRYLGVPEVATGHCLGKSQS